jgi:hypothetical protein
LMGYMRVLSMLLSAVLLCGCIGEAVEPPTTTSSTEVTTTSLQDEFVSITLLKVPTSSTQTTTSSTDTTLAGAPTTISSSTTLDPLIRTFTDKGGAVCRSGGKPIIRVYSKLECEHCQWSGPMFDRVAREYADEGLIVAHHWVFDTNDDILTDGQEKEMPALEYDTFLIGNSTTVPYFSFGCRFTRIGNGYQIQKRPDKEESEYRAVIEHLIGS